MHQSAYQLQIVTRVTSHVDIIGSEILLCSYRSSRSIDCETAHRAILEHLEQQSWEPKQLRIAQTAVMTVRSIAMSLGRGLLPTAQELDAAFGAIAPATVQNHWALQGALLASATVTAFPYLAEFR